jgi:squalene synthase HpnC
MSETKSILLETCDAIPAAYRLPTARPSLDEAREHCARLAKQHYENFHVMSGLLPKAVRPHFSSVYAYCRISDDLGDEMGDRVLALQLLDEWGQLLDECYAAPQRSRHPVYVALAETIAKCKLPKQLFADLLTAFRMDQSKVRHADWNSLLEYSHFSANPVGRLVLGINNIHDEETARFSDEICTGLQIANFCQDVVRDFAIGRIYIPQDAMRQHGIDDAKLAQMITARKGTPEFRAMMQQLVARVRTMLAEGEGIVGRVATVHKNGELAAVLGLFVAGGMAVLDAIEAQGYDVLRKRPVVGKVKKLQLLSAAMTRLTLARAGKLFSGRSA